MQDKLNIQLLGVFCDPGRHLSENFFAAGVAPSSVVLGINLSIGQYYNRELLVSLSAGAKQKHTDCTKKQNPFV